MMTTTTNNMSAQVFESARFNYYTSITAGTHIIFAYPESSSKTARVFFSIVPMSETRPFFKAVMYHGEYQKKIRFNATTTDKHVLETRYGKHYLCTMSELAAYLEKARSMVACKPAKINQGHAVELALCERVFSCEWESNDLDKPHTVSGDITVGAYEYQVKFKGGRM